MNKWKLVTEKELIDFVRSYPAPLNQDYYMDLVSWNDFTDGKKFPDSMVAIASYLDNEFRIKE